MKKVFMILAVAAIAVAAPSCGGDKKADNKKTEKKNEKKDEKKDGDETSDEQKSVSNVAEKTNETNDYGTVDSQSGATQTSGDQGAEHASDATLSPSDIKEKAASFVDALIKCQQDNNEEAAFALIVEMETYANSLSAEDKTLFEQYIQAFAQAMGGE